MNPVSDPAQKTEYIRNLVHKVAQGDHHAFNDLFEEFYRKISRFVWLRVNHKQTAEDLTAEVFIKVWNSLQKEEPPLSFSNWVFTIARNRVIDHYRTQKSFSNLQELETFLEYEDHIVETLDLDIATKEILGAMEELSEDQRQVLRLKLLEDLDNEEISAVVGKPSGTIRVIQHRAIMQVKKLVKSKKPGKRNETGEN